MRNSRNQVEVKIESALKSPNGVDDLTCAFLVWVGREVTYGDTI